MARETKPENLGFRRTISRRLLLFELFAPFGDSLDKVSRYDEVVLRLFVSVTISKKAASSS